MTTATYKDEQNQTMTNDQVILPPKCNLLSLQKNTAVDALSPEFLNNLSVVLRLLPKEQ